MISNQYLSDFSDTTMQVIEINTGVTAQTLNQFQD